LLILQVPLAWYMVDLPDGPGLTKPYNLHKSIGMTLFSLAVVRLIWALLSSRPPLPTDTALWEKVTAKTSQAILYFLVMLMPVSGWMGSSLAGIPVHVFGLFTLPMLTEPDKTRVESFADMHEIQSLILLTVITLHLCGALKHHFISKDNILNSMLPFRRPE
jgi:cytochrome b561